VRRAISKTVTALLASAALLLQARVARATETPIENFDAPGAIADWTFSNGPEFPGAQGSLTPGNGHTGSGAQLAFDFSGGGQYVSASYTFPTPLTTEAIALWVLPTLGIHVTLRVTDSTGQTLQYQTDRPLDAFDPSAWYRVVVPIGASTSFWGGANDGSPHMPLKSMSVLAADPVDPTLAGDLDFDDVTAIDPLGAQAIDPAHGTLLPAPPGASTLAPRIGVNIHFTHDDAALDFAEAAGFSSVRMDLGWSGVETTQGAYDFSSFDDLVAALASRHMHLHLILDYMNALYPGPGTSGFASTTVPAFAAVVKATTQHFAGKGVTYEVWNEPNLDGFWPPQANATEYAELCKAAIAAGHAGDSNAKISTAGISGFDMAFLEAYLQAGGGAGADAIGVHPYRQTGGESVLGDTLYMKSIIAKYFASPPPIWDTEWGYSSTWYGGDGHAAAARTTQAELAARELLSAWAIGFPLAIYYDVRDDGTDPTNAEHNFGLIQNDYQDKPAAVAVRTLSSVAKGRTFVGFLRTNVSTLTAMRLDGPNDTVVAAWSSSSLPTPITVAVGTTGVDMLGAPLALDADGGALGLSLTDSGGPVYLTFPKVSAPPDAGSDASPNGGSGGTSGDASSNAGTGGANASDAGPDASAGRARSNASSGCGCTTAPASSSPVWPGAVLFGTWIVAERRRRGERRA
jgi:Cellulase (glycosyl hydrolase family 5)